MVFVLFKLLFVSTNFLQTYKMLFVVFKLLFELIRCFFGHRMLFGSSRYTVYVIWTIGARPKPAAMHKILFWNSSVPSAGQISKKKKKTSLWFPFSGYFIAAVIQVVSGSDVRGMSRLCLIKTPSSCGYSARRFQY